MTIQQFHKAGIPVKILCEIAGISRSSYYKWTTRTPSKLEEENKIIIEEMIQLHEKVKGIYGYRRLTMNLRRTMDMPINRKRIRCLMKVAGIETVIRRPRYRYKHSTPQHVAENLLNRDFSAENSNEKWLTDVTEFKYGNGQKAYLSAILDIVNWTQKVRHNI